LHAGMNPTDTELQAICYNRACAHTKLGNLPAACEDLKRAYAQPCHPNLLTQQSALSGTLESPTATLRRWRGRVAQ
jgi:hypothetical protein